MNRSIDILRPCVAASGGTLIAFVGICHELMGASLYPWAPPLFGSTVAWHAAGVFTITLGTLAFLGATGTLRVPGALVGVPVGSFAGVIVLVGALKFDVFHIFALAAGLGGMAVAWADPTPRGPSRRRTMADREPGIRVPSDEYAALNLHAHSFLRGVPLHDAWRIRLEGAGPNTGAREAVDSFLKLEADTGGPAVKALFALREWLGRTFGWDTAEAVELQPDSYATRVTGSDRARSIVEPGTVEGPMAILYMFEDEALAEVINKTVHAFLAFAVVPDPGGCTVYWGIYVKPVSRWTGAYMALIDPFRRWIVYPALIRKMERSWRSGVGG